MINNDLKLKEALDKVDNIKSCQISLYYLKKFEEIFSDEKNINSLKTDIRYNIFLDLYSILKRLEKIDNITPSNHLINLIEIKLRKIDGSSMFSRKIDNELFNNYHILINYLTILVNDILSSLNGSNLNTLSSLLDHFIMHMEHYDDFDDSDIDDSDVLDLAYKKYIKKNEDYYEFSAEEGYDNWFEK